MLRWANFAASYVCIYVIDIDRERTRGKCCGFTGRKCNYTAVMSSMINDVGL